MRRHANSGKSAAASCWLFHPRPLLYRRQQQGTRTRGGVLWFARERLLFTANIQICTQRKRIGLRLRVHNQTIVISMMSGMVDR